MTVSETAALLQVSKRQLERAMRVLRLAHPAVGDAVRDGVLNLHQAERWMALWPDPEEQARQLADWVEVPPAERPAVWRILNAAIAVPGAAPVINR